MDQEQTRYQVFDHILNRTIYDGDRMDNAFEETLKIHKNGLQLLGNME